MLFVVVDEERETGEQAEQEAGHEEQIAQRALDVAVLAGAAPPLCHPGECRGLCAGGGLSAGFTRVRVATACVAAIRTGVSDRACLNNGAWICAICTSTYVYMICRY